MKQVWTTNKNQINHNIMHVLTLTEHIYNNEVSECFLICNAEHITYFLSSFSFSSSFSTMSVVVFIVLFGILWSENGKIWN